MQDNDVKLIRVYTAEKGGIILEQNIPSDAEFEVVVEARAGAAIFSTAGSYEIHIIVRDLTDFTIAHKDSITGIFTQEPWDEPVLPYAFPIPAQGAVKESHIYDVLASLSVGIKNPNVSFVKSPMFMISKP